jgi:hypothetical protein
VLEEMKSTKGGMGLGAKERVFEMTLTGKLLKIKD